MTAARATDTVFVPGMPQRKLALAVLLMLGMAVATIEESFIHDDDGCVMETHCNACLLQLGSAGVLTATFSLSPATVALDEVVSPATPSREQALPTGLPSRGPPLG